MHWATIEGADGNRVNPHNAVPGVEQKRKHVLPVPVTDELSDDSGGISRRADYARF